MSDIPDCPLCGTWKCDVCGHRSYYQNPRYMGGRKCNQCGSRKGTFRGVRHISAAVRREHEAINDFLPTTEHKFEHYKSWDQYASFLARQEMEEMMEQAMPESPASSQTAQDFEKAEWAKHPAGMFAHRGGPHGGGAAWAVASPISDDVTYYTDVELADRGDFEIVETSTILTHRELKRIEDAQDDGVSVEEILVQAGVKIVEDEPLEVPQDFGVRFLAKSGAGLVEWEFVTVRVDTEDGTGIGVLCTDIRDWNGLLVPRAEFTERGFHVVELL